MRVSTPLQYTQYTSSLLDNQSKVNETIEKISSGKRIITSGDDPTSMLTADNLNQYNSSIAQYKMNITGASYRMGFSETTIGSMDDMMLRSRDLILQGNNGALDSYGRENVAYELEQLYEGMLAFVNIKDESDNFVFSGYSTNIQPFERSNGQGIRYMGDAGEQVVLVDNELTTVTNVSGDALVMKAVNPAGELQPIYLEGCEGEVIIDTVMRNTYLEPSQELTLQDNYTFEFSQRAGVKVAWKSPLRSQQAPMRLLMSNTA